MRTRTVLVTGASSGLGLATACALARAGHRVYAGARSFAGQEGPCAAGFTRVALDVTDPESIARALAQTGPVEALVCCAARIVLGSCEETSPEELRAVLETNFLGMVAMVQAVLPHMRAAGGGLIVPFSSLNGLLGIPFTPAYVASKHAIEGWAECLRQETHRFGIRVCVVRPGDHRSGSAAYRQRARAAQQPASPYAEAFARATAAIARDEAGGAHPEPLARAVARAVSAHRPPCTLLVARPDQRLAVWLHDLLSPALFSAIMRRYYGGKQTRRSGAAPR